MGYHFVAFRQDLQAAAKALESEDFENMNIYSNRIMSNAIFDGERKLALPGFFLKDVAFVVGNLKARSPTAPFSTAKALAAEYVKKLFDKTAHPEFAEAELWTQYHEFMERVRKFMMDPIEEKAYGQANLSFTHDAFQWLIAYLERKKNTLTHPKNLLLKGVLNEMSRLYRNHGFQMSETYAISLITALDWCNDYVRTTARSDTDFEERVKNEVLPYAERVIEVLRKRQPNVDEVNKLLWELIKTWREYFIEFMERRRVAIEPAYEPEKGIELPEETRKKLTEAVTRSLERETKPAR